MSHRQKHKHKSRHSTHAVKPNLQQVPLPPYVAPDAPVAENKPAAPVQNTKTEVAEPVAV